MAYRLTAIQADVLFRMSERPKGWWQPCDLADRPGYGVSPHLLMLLRKGLVERTLVSRCQYMYRLTEDGRRHPVLRRAA